ncbi:hypothetical protein IEQ11_14220 [Lysobacter capsici]|uniref:Lipoprotein n=1 Tax=Lysobacter capsici AZ78 TaxID=1444315 RepID=A0A125U098_9GAMM|nr:hypothetical protein [Lysobacter capsici]KWS02513.1 hypothetical protein AZ78_0057 [Lysobacter capsici AZ78]UOF12916.1 hypothetical protein IEQ11_14220 [Lysobacter capsici]
MNHASAIAAAALLASTLALSACDRASAPQAAAPPKPERAGQPLDAAKTAERLVKMRAQAFAGDQQGLQENLQGLNHDVSRSIRLADQARKVDRENARVAAKSVKGVNSVVWIDGENLLALVNQNTQRSYDTIDAICTQLEPLGDTLGVVVNLQSRAARTGDELEILSRNCQLPPGERAMMQRNRQIDVLPPEVRAQHRANADAALAGPDRSAERAENERIIRSSTPEL